MTRYSKAASVFGWIFAIAALVLSAFILKAAYNNYAAYVGAYEEASNVSTQ